jgi:hypothetical protein
MSDGYEERGLFKQIVLIAWLALACFLNWWDGEE